MASGVAVSRGSLSKPATAAARASAVSGSDAHKVWAAVLPGSIGRPRLSSTSRAISRSMRTPATRLPSSQRCTADVPPRSAISMSVAVLSLTVSISSIRLAADRVTPGCGINLPIPSDPLRIRSSSVIALVSERRPASTSAR